MKEQDAAHSLNPEESLLVKMSAILNSIAREYDSKIPSPALKSLIDKGYHLSIQSLEHLGVLDEQAKELTRLRSELQDTKSYYEDKLDARQRIIDRQFSELQQERELKKELVECIESYVDLELFSNPKPIESLIKKAKLNN